METVAPESHMPDITRARTPMPKSTQNYIARCEHFATGALAITRHRLVA